MRSHPQSATSSANAGIDGLVVDHFGLAELIHRAPATIIVDRCRRPETLPPACVPRGTRRPLWLVSDVLAWLASHREAATERPRPVGRPPKTRRTSGRIGVQTGQEEVSHG